MTTEPREAKAFIKGGISGLGAAVVIVIAADKFGYHIGPTYVPHLIAIGYIVGAFFGLWLSEQAHQHRLSQRETLPAQLPPPSARSLPYSPEQPFRYASWDDEEARR